MKIFYSLIIITLVLTSCISAEVTEDTITSEQAYTSVALTVNANLETANAPTTTPSLTSTLSLSLSATPTVSPSSTGEITPSPTTQSVELPPPSACDDAVYLSDLTIPDGTHLSPGEVFTKTWRIQNSGTCTWTSGYAVAYVDGSMMGATTPISLTVDTVSPRGTVDISIGMVAPETSGQQVGYWRMQNAAGIGFGVTFYVDIFVTGSAEPGESTMTLTAAGITATQTSTRRIRPRATPTP